MKIVVIMPTYNEASNISRMIEVLCIRCFPKIDKADMRLLVVDGNSRDETRNIVQEKMKKFPKLYLLSEEGRGLGTAYISGMKYAMQCLQADAVIEMDADFQHDPCYISDFVSAFESGADYALGSRFIKDGSIPADWALYRRAVSYFGNRFIKSMLRFPDIHDLTTGFRLTRVKGVLDQIDLDNLMAKKRFAYKLDLLYRTIHLSGKIIEIPINFRSRTREISKFSLMEVIASLKVVLTIVIKKAMMKKASIQSR